MINSTYDRRLFWCLFSSQDYHRESDNSHSMQRKSGGGGVGGGVEVGRGGGLIEVFLNSSFSTYLKVIIVLTKSSEIQG